MHRWSHSGLEMATSRVESLTTSVGQTQDNRHLAIDFGVTPLERRNTQEVREEKGLSVNVCSLSLSWKSSAPIQNARSSKLHGRAMPESNQHPRRERESSIGVRVLSVGLSAVCCIAAIRLLLVAWLCGGFSGVLTVWSRAPGASPPASWRRPWRRFPRRPRRKRRQLELRPRWSRARSRRGRPHGPSPSGCQASVLFVT